MPGNNPSPIPAIFAELDLRVLSGQALYTRSVLGIGTVTISAPTFSAATPGTTGIYEDWLDFLHGYGSEPLNTLQADLTTGWTGTGAAGAMSITLTSDDKIKLSSTLASFSIKASADNTFFGFPTSLTSATGAGPYSLTATDSWVRGNNQNKYLTLAPGASPAFFVPTLNTWSQSAVTMFRSRSNESDADDNQTNTTTLEGIDNTATMHLARLVRWFVTDDGRIGWSLPNAVCGGDPIFGLNPVFREMIGWSGNETVTTSGGVCTQIGDYYASRCLVPTRPLERLTRDVLVEDTAERLRGGGIASNKMGTYDRINIEGWIDGPSDSRDLHRHWLQNVAPYLTRGKRCTVYFEWGDPRRGLESFKVTNTQDAYDLLYSTEKDGERARYRGRIDVDGGGSFVVDWPQANRRRAPMSLNIAKAED